MTMMSRNSSDSSLDDQGSTVSSKSGQRKSLGSLAAQNRRMRDRDSPSESSDMPSLSTFRLDEMSASAASRGDSYVSSRVDCDISLPSLSSFRMEDMSLASSYHSGTNHLSEESAEGWSSFTSGNVSPDTDSDSDGEFATSSSAPGSERGDSALSSMPAPKSGILKDNGAPVDTVDSTPDDANCNLTSNARPPRRRSPETEELKSSLPMRPPRRTLSPISGKRADMTEQGAQTGKDEEISRPTRSSSPERTPVERTESLPLSVLQKPRPAQEGSSSSVRVSGDSSSSLRGGDSLPRLPRRTSTLDDRSAHAEEETEADDDTKISAEASRVSDEDTKMSFDDVTDVSEGDVSIDSDLSDDESIVRKPLHTHDKLDREGATNSHKERIIESTEPIEQDSRAAASLSKRSDAKRKTKATSQPHRTEAEQNQHDSHPVEPLKAQNYGHADAQKQSIGESETSSPTKQKATTPQEESAEEARKDPSTNVSHMEKSDPEPDESIQPQNEANEKEEAPPDAPNEADPGSSSNAGSKDGKGPVRNRKSPTSVRELEGALPAKEPDDKTPDESGATSAEESGTTASDTEAEESEEINNRSRKEDSKRGRLLRKMSNSFRNIGKSTSFKNSFRMIGRTASKLKNMGRREDGQKKEGQRSNHDSADPDSNN